jgi:alpha-L-fucosidase
VEYEAEILKGAGDWLRTNHEAIYGTQAQPFRHLPFGYATVRDNRLYLIVKQMPKDGRLNLPGLETRIQRAYLLRDAKKSPLLTGGEQGRDKSVTISADGQPFLPVIVVECEGPPHVRQPFAEPASDGTLILRQGDGDRFFNANGEGYYDPPTLREERWKFTANRSGRYRVEAQYRSGAFSRLIQIRVGDQELRFPVYGLESSPVFAGLVTLSEGKETELRISPAMPAERGTALGVDVSQISLIPESSGVVGK